MKTVKNKSPKNFRVILLIDASGSYGRGLLRGIAKYSRLHGPWIFFSLQKGLALPHFENIEADGIIMFDQKKNAKMLARGLPTILVIDEKEQVDYPHIVTDSAALGKMAAEYFLDRGFRNFAYCGYNDRFWSRNNGESFSKRVSQAGFNVDFFRQPQSRIQHSWPDEQTVMDKWLKSLPKPVAILACHDECGRRVIEACKIGGLRVPEQAAVLGGDNDDLICDLTTPTLSSIDLNVESTGYEAAELLHKLMAGKEKMHTQEILVHPTHIVTRQSTDTQAIDDRDVAEAVRFIREHAKETLQVSNVTEAIAVSRRNLEKKFQRILGRSILNEIKRVRIEQITNLLLETDLSISQISQRLRYASIDNICRYFKKVTGMSPLAYRKHYRHK